MPTESSPPAPQPRPGFLPGLLGAIVLVAALALIGTGWYTVVQYVVCILALIMAVMAWQGRRFVWLAPLAIVAILWNPVLPLELPREAWIWLNLVGAVVLVGVGVTMRVPARDARPTNR